MFVDLEELQVYENKDHFFFSSNKDLGKVCNAPKDSSGVYIIFELKDGRITLVYIGCSGKMKSGGTIQHRIGGMHDRIVNGKQFGDSRQKSWKKKLIDENIDALDIYWYETYNKEVQHIPAFVEGLLLQIYFEFYGTLPAWNLEY